jgi:ribosomal protein S15P/S13E
MLSQAESNRIKVAEIVQQFQHKDGDTGSTPVQGGDAECLLAFL